MALAWECAGLPVWLALAAFLCIFLACSRAGASLEEKQSLEPPSPHPHPIGTNGGHGEPWPLELYSRHWKDRVKNTDIFLTLSDGSVCALDANTGTTKWRSKIGNPLFLSSSAADSTPGSLEDSLGTQDPADLRGKGTQQQQKHAGRRWSGDEEKVGGIQWVGEDHMEHGTKPQDKLIPGADGMLYHYSPDDGLQELSYSVRELVQSSPSVTSNGELIVGSRSTTVVLMDVANGRILHSFNTSTQGFAPPSAQGSFLSRCEAQFKTERGEQLVSEGSNESAGVREDINNREVSEEERETCRRIWESALYFVRTDYVVKSYEMATGTLRWNVSYGEVSSLQDSNKFGSFMARSRGPGRQAMGGVSPQGSLASDGKSTLIPLDEFGDLKSRSALQLELSGQHSKATLPESSPSDSRVLPVNGAYERHGTLLRDKSPGATLELVAGSEACSAGTGSLTAPQYCVQMRDPGTNALKWTAALPSVPLSAFSATGKTVQNFMGLPRGTESRSSVLFLPQAGGQPGTAFVLPRPFPVSSAAPSQIMPLPAGRAGKFTVPAVSPGQGGALVPVEARHGRDLIFEGLTCDTAERVWARPVTSSQTPPVTLNRLPGPGVPDLGECGDACAEPPKPAPEPGIGAWSFMGISYTLVFLAAVAVGIVAAFPVVSWLQRLRDKGKGVSIEEWEKERKTGGGRRHGAGRGKGGGPAGEGSGPGHRRRKKGHTPVKRQPAEESQAGLDNETENGAPGDENESPLVSMTATPQLGEVLEKAYSREGPAGSGAGDADGASLRRHSSGGRAGPLTESSGHQGMALAEAKRSDSGGRGWGRWERDEVPSLAQDAARVGRLRVGNKVIGYGSHGTVVLEGELEGRPVAVKRLLSQFYEKARKEISALIATDEHPNVVRCFAMEEDGAFVYVALERCTMSLADLIAACARGAGPTDSRVSLDCAVPAKGAAIGKDLNKSMSGSGSSDFVADCHVAAAAALAAQGLKLWDDSGFPTPTLLGVLRDIVAGLAHLHSQRIVHRDLKPQNVLVLVQRQHVCRRGKRTNSEGCLAGSPSVDHKTACPIRLRAKLSDMGISKRLADEASSFDQHTAGSGSSGWQAPEQLEDGQRQTRSVDLFPLGSLLFYCISAGRHAFGSRYERDANVLCGRFDLFPVAHVPEAEHLIRQLLQKDPEKRPSAAEVSVHPLLWSPEVRLSFLKDASDRVEREDRVEGGSALLDELESTAHDALGAGQWKDRIDAALLGNLGMYRRYNFRSVRDLLRVIRNKCNHYRELPEDVQALFGTMPEGFEHYFRQRFPRLLIEVYLVLKYHCFDDHVFSKYFIPHANPSLPY